VHWPQDGGQALLQPPKYSIKIEHSVHSVVEGVDVVVAPKVGVGVELVHLHPDPRSAHLARSSVVDVVVAAA